MIVPMKKTTLICLQSDQLATLEKLRELGVMHVEIIDKPAESEDRSQLALTVGRLEKAVGFLALRKPSASDEKPSGLEDRLKLAEAVFNAIDENSSLQKDLEQLKRDYKNFLPWGEFSGELLRELRNNGVFVTLCEGTAKDLARLPEGISPRIVSQDKYKYYFAVISQEALDLSDFNVVSLPENLSLAQIEQDLAQCREKLQENENRLNHFAADNERLAGLLAATREKMEFITNRDAMDKSGQLVTISGFVPSPAIAELIRAAGKNGWALHYEDADIENPRVPTLIEIPKIFRICKPIFDFIGIMPGYSEWDVSICFLFFFTIFFGMIVGDAGYGLLFLAITIILKIKYRIPKYRLAQNLMIVLSLATITWGILTCTWFGIGQEKLYAFLPEWLHGYPKFTGPLKDKYVQYFCFILAAVHLSFARLWKAILTINSRKCLGEIGWAMLVWANCFTAIELIVFQGTFPKMLGFTFYILGFLLTAAFSIDWKNIGEILNFPFGLIGSFVDVLSYIRLFAVGLSTYYIANSFNNMGAMIMGISNSTVYMILLMIPAVIVILFGHILNILLALMGVLVHGIRLNTLEFSNHMGLKWAGYFYRPFKKNELAEERT